MIKYQLVVCGGTFDHFHKGHEAFLSFAFLRSERVLIGLTSDIYIEKSEKIYNNSIETYSVRYKNLRNFLKSKKLLSRCLIEPIDTLDIPSVWNKFSIQAIVVTPNSTSGAIVINNKRIKEGRKSLVIISSPLFKSSDEIIISSNLIRRGIIDREGKLFIQKDWQIRRLKLPENLRPVLSKPFGKVITDIPFVKKISKSELLKKCGITKDSLVVTVGDVVTNVFNAHKIFHKVSVIDFMINRKKMHREIEELGFGGNEKIFYAKNAASSLTPSLFFALRDLFYTLSRYDRAVLLVEGEEDLSVLPMTLSAPLGSIIFYGQPGVGIVRVFVDEASKTKARAFLTKFQILQA